MKTEQIQGPLSARYRYSVLLPDPILDLFDWSRIICRAESIMKQIALAITSIEENNEIPSN